MIEYELIGNAMIFGVQTDIKIKLKNRATYHENQACRFWGWRFQVSTIKNVSHLVLS